MTGEQAITVTEPPKQITALRTALERMPDMTPSEVLLFREQVEFLAGQLREFRRELEDATIAYIDANGDIDAGNDTRYYVGFEKKTKCLDRNATLKALLDASGGDIDRLSECLASDAFKHGACKKVLNTADFERCFEVSEVKDLRTGALRREVKKADGNRRW